MEEVRMRKRRFRPIAYFADSILFCSITDYYALKAGKKLAFS